MFKSVDRFTKIFIITAVLIAIATPFIANQYQNLQQEAAGKGNYINGTITLNELNPVYGQTVSFTVSTNARDRDIYKLWVANRCQQGGVPMSQEYLPIKSGTAGPFNLNWSNGEAATCTAYVWFFPDTETAVKGASVTYSVAAR